MRLRIDEAMHEAGAIETILDQDEAAFVKLSVEADRVGLTLVPGVSHPHPTVLPERLASQEGFDADGEYHQENDHLIQPLLRATPDAQGETAATWTRLQVYGILHAVHSAAHLVTESRHSPTEGVPSPLLGTILAVMAASSSEESDGLISDFLREAPFEPPRELPAGEESTPGVRADMGFQAAAEALHFDSDYTHAAAVVRTFNAAVAVTVGS